MSVRYYSLDFVPVYGLTAMKTSLLRTLDPCR